MIPYGRQNIDQADIDAVTDVLKSDWLTQGPAVPKFENVVANYCGVQHAVAVNSATSALHLACLSLGLGDGDSIWTSPITFVASANCGRYCGADVDFVDICPRTYNMSIDALKEKLESADRDGRLPKIVVPVHFAGQSCDMKSLRKLADIYGFFVIEDASHAIGGHYDGGPIGDCRYSDITVFSFHPVKIITTGEGGLALTKNEVLADKMRQLRSHGITRDFKQITGNDEGSWYYEQRDLGYNYRLTDIQAALGVSQMQRLVGFVAQREQIASRYDDLLQDFPLTRPWQHPDTSSAWHLYVIRLHLDKVRKSRRDVFDAMKAEGIGVNVHYIPVHTQPYYRSLGFNVGMFPNAENYYREAITLPLYPGIDKEMQHTVVTKLKSCIV